MALKGSSKAVRAALGRIGNAVGQSRTVTATLTIRIVDATGTTRSVKRTIKLVK